MQPHLITSPAVPLQNSGPAEGPAPCAATAADDYIFARFYFPAALFPQPPSRFVPFMLTRLGLPPGRADCLGSKRATRRMGERVRGPAGVEREGAEQTTLVEIKNLPPWSAAKPRRHARNRRGARRARRQQRGRDEKDESASVHWRRRKQRMQPAISLISEELYRHSYAATCSGPAQCRQRTRCNGRQSSSARAERRHDCAPYSD